MHRIGTVQRIAQGLLVARTDDDPPDSGTTVIDEQLEEVGEVVSTFGPVDRPYVVVRPTDDSRLAALIDEPLYVR